MARWWLENPILWMKYIVWKNKSSYHKTILLREEQHNNEKILNTILDHNTSLLKHNDTYWQWYYSSKSPNGSTDKTSKDIFNNKLPANISTKNQNKKGSKKTNKNFIIPDNNKNGNNVVYT